MITGIGLISEKKYVDYKHAMYGIQHKKSFNTSCEDGSAICAHFRAHAYVKKWINVKMFTGNVPLWGVCANKWYKHNFDAQMITVTATFY